MARKKKDSEPVVTESSQSVDLSEAPVADVAPHTDESSESCSTVSVSDDGERSTSVSVDDIESQKIVAKMMENTLEEIERCDDYIESGMDASGIWKINKREWRYYRYLLRQVPLQSQYPKVVVYPQRPVRLDDE